MADRMRQAQQRLANRLHQVRATTVTYRRGSDSVVVTALVGRTLFRQQVVGSTQASTVVWGDRDYLIQAADLDFGAGPITPRKGDKIIDTDRTSDVYAPDGEPVFRPSDEYGIQLRIHTRQVPG